MARKRKAKDIEAETEVETEAGSETDGEGIGHNSKVDLTDDQLQALFFSHKRLYESALATKKAADAAFKNTCKIAKAELGDDAVDSIKDAILLDTEEGEAKLKSRIERQLRVARWMAVPLGNQSDLFSDVADRTPAVDRAYAAGKRVGMEGAPNKPPHDPSVPQFDAWMEGWSAGQAAIFNIQRERDAGMFEEDAAGEDGDPPPPIGDQDSTAQVQH